MTAVIAPYVDRVVRLVQSNPLCQIAAPTCYGLVPAFLKRLDSYGNRVMTAAVCDGLFGERGDGRVWLPGVDVLMFDGQFPASMVSLWRYQSERGLEVPRLVLLTDQVLAGLRDELVSDATASTPRGRQVLARKLRRVR